MSHSLIQGLTVLLITLTAQASDRVQGRGYGPGGLDRARSERSAFTRARHDAIERTLRARWGIDRFERWESEVEAILRSGRLDDAISPAKGRQGPSYTTEDSGLVVCRAEFSIDWKRIEEVLRGASIPTNGESRAKVVVAPHPSARTNEATAELHDLAESKLCEHLLEASEGRLSIRDRARVEELTESASIRGQPAGNEESCADLAVWFRLDGDAVPRQSAQGDWRVRRRVRVQVVRLDNGEELLDRSFEGRGRSIHREDSTRRAMLAAIGKPSKAGSAVAMVSKALLSEWKRVREEGLEYTVSLSSQVIDPDVFLPFFESLKSTGRRVRLATASSPPYGKEYFFRFHQYSNRGLVSTAAELLAELNAFLAKTEESHAVESPFARLSHAAGRHMVFSVYSTRRLQLDKRDRQKLEIPARTHDIESTQNPSSTQNLIGTPRPLAPESPRSAQSEDSAEPFDDAPVAVAAPAGRGRLESLAETVRSGVVHISVEDLDSGSPLLSTGFLVSRSGQACTARRALPARPGKISVRFQDGSLRSARILRSAPEPVDIVLLQIDGAPQSAYVFELGTDHDIEVGALAAIVGKPHLDRLFQTSGVISSAPVETPSGGEPRAFLYDITTYLGSTGAPIVRIDGGVRVIGVHSAGISEENLGASASTTAKLTPIPGFAHGSAVGELERLVDGN